MKKSVLTSNGDMRKYLNKISESTETYKKSEPRIQNSLVMKSSVRRSILEGIEQLDTVLIEHAEYQLQDSIWTSEIINEMMLAEKRSTLFNLIGDNPGGQALAEYLHKRFKLSASVTYGEVASGRIFWKGFKSNEDHFMIIRGKAAVIAIKPDEGDVAAKRSRNPNYSQSGDTTLIYNVVGFASDKRIDNLLIPMPEQEDFELPKSEGGGIDNSAYQAAVDDVKKRRQMTLNVDAPPTRISGKRGGDLVRPDKAESLLSRIKLITAGVMDADTSSVAASGERVRKSGMQNGILNVYTVTGELDDQQTSKRDMATKIDTDEPTAFDSIDKEKWPRFSGIDRPKLQARKQYADSKVRTDEQELQYIRQRLSAIVPKMIQQADSRLESKLQRFTANNDKNSADKVLNSRKRLSTFSSNGIIPLIDGAIYQAHKSSPDLSASEFIKELNQSTANLAPVINNIRAALMAV